MNASRNELSFNKVVLLALISGMRSMMAPALLSMNVKTEDKAGLHASRLDFVGQKRTQDVLGVLTTAELIGDKLPFTPSRIKPSQLTVRLLSGAAVGALTYSLAGREARKGAALGGIVSLASTTVFFTLRKALSLTRIIPEPFTGLAEDITAFYLAGRYLDLQNNHTGTRTNLV